MYINMKDSIYQTSARCADCVAYMSGSCMLTELSVREDDGCMDFRTCRDFSKGGCHE